MTWFQHRHYWRPKTALNTVKEPVTKAVVGGLLLEDCLCGAVRQIEFRPDMVPIVTVVEPAKLRAAE